MNKSSRYPLYIGIIIIFLSIINILLSESINPSLIRAEVLSGLSGVVMMLISFLWFEVIPNKPKISNFNGEQGFIIEKNLSIDKKNELAWGSQLILTATPAATLLIIWNNNVILKRGIITNNSYTIGDITKRVIKTNKFLVMSKLNIYPGNQEFDNILPNIPSLIIAPLNNKGALIVGGFSERCFSKSDELWIKGWSNKIIPLLES